MRSAGGTRKPMRQYLVLRLEAPFTAFGGETIDNCGVIRPFPAKSMITGLLANALGIERQQSELLQALQDGLIMGSRIDSCGEPVRDFQTAQLSKNDQGWTTLYRIEGRSGGSASYAAPHLRYRDYWTGLDVSIVIGLTPSAPVNIQTLSNALAEPARPLFLGRKSCIPSGPILDGQIAAKTTLQAILRLPGEGLRFASARLQWPAFGDPEDDDVILPGDCHARIEPICDERNWITGVHGGFRFVRVLQLKEVAGKQP
jgi:CRISPR system Cascade subunit CasD